MSYDSISFVDYDQSHAYNTIISPVDVVTIVVLSTELQTDRQTDRQAGRQAHRQAD